MFERGEGDSAEAKMKGGLNLVLVGRYCVHLLEYRRKEPVVTILHP